MESILLERSPTFSSYFNSPFSSHLADLCLVQLEHTLRHLGSSPLVVDLSLPAYVHFVLYTLPLVSFTSSWPDQVNLLQQVVFAGEGKKLLQLQKLKKYLACCFSCSPAPSYLSAESNYSAQLQSLSAGALNESVSVRENSCHCKNIQSSGQRDKVH